MFHLSLYPIIFGIHLNNLIFDDGIDFTSVLVTSHYITVFGLETVSGSLDELLALVVRFCYYS